MLPPPNGAPVGLWQFHARGPGLGFWGCRIDRALVFGVAPSLDLGLHGLCTRFAFGVSGLPGQAWECRGPTIFSISIKVFMGLTEPAVNPATSCQFQEYFYRDAEMAPGWPEAKILRVTFSSERRRIRSRSGDRGWSQETPKVMLLRAQGALRF